VAIGNLRDLGEQEHLSKYTLVSDHGSIILVENDAAIDLVKKPGQQVMAIMSDVLGPYLNKNDIEIPALFHPRKHIVVNPEVRAGHPVIVGTRVPYEHVAELIDDGVPAAEIGEYYPAVEAPAARDAWDFAKYVDGWRSTDRPRNSVA
jgi:uncharacterized protein (DUF433 family)